MFAVLRHQCVLHMQAQLADAGAAEVTVNGTVHTIRRDMVTIGKVTKTVSGRNYTPSVIEPSFGVGRILYCVFEHSFYTRPGDDQQRTVFRFTPTVAPMKTTVFPLLQRQELNEVATKISLELRRAGISSIIDTTGGACLCMLAHVADDKHASMHDRALYDPGVVSVHCGSSHHLVSHMREMEQWRKAKALGAGITIGKRYARTDELGVPFAITVDYGTIHDGGQKDSVTLRERDTMEQVRVPIAELVPVLRGLCENVAEATSWQALKQQYPLQEAAAEA